MCITTILQFCIVTLYHECNDTNDHNYHLPIDGVASEKLNEYEPKVSVMRVVIFKATVLHMDIWTGSMRADRLQESDRRQGRLVGGGTGIQIRHSKAWINLKRWGGMVQNIYQRGFFFYENKKKCNVKQRKKVKIVLNMIFIMGILIMLLFGPVRP